MYRQTQLFCCAVLLSSSCRGHQSLWKSRCYCQPPFQSRWMKEWNRWKFGSEGAGAQGRACLGKRRRGTQTVSISFRIPLLCTPRCCNHVPQLGFKSAHLLCSHKCPASKSFVAVQVYSIIDLNLNVSFHWEGKQCQSAVQMSRTGCESDNPNVLFHKADLASVPYEFTLYIHMHFWVSLSFYYH